jgi:erythromycin esterase-like protein
MARAAPTARNDIETLLRREVSAVEQILDHIGDRRLVLLGEATHGTSEFYRFRAAVSAALIERRGFRIVALEADWPDARRLDDFVRHRKPAGDWTAFARFPTWMWRNREMLDFSRWLRERNLRHAAEDRAGIYGLDLYSLSSSIAAVLDYLHARDPELARRAAERYACFSPFLEDPASYGPVMRSWARSRVASAKRSRCSRTCCGASWRTRERMRTGSSTQRRMRGWSRMPRPITAASITAMPIAGICATAICPRR